MIQIGIRGHQETTVTEDLLAKNVGSGSVKVFATPMMISLIEKAAVLSVVPYLEDGQDSVGTLINVTHCSATPLGMKVWADTELVEIDRRRLVFKVAAYDERGLIGEGMHERFIINKAAFQAKADSK
jgi:fluoroacetyl-CoA thioesterase